MPYRCCNLSGYAVQDRMVSWLAAKHPRGARPTRTRMAAPAGSTFLRRVLPGNAGRGEPRRGDVRAEVIPCIRLVTSRRGRALGAIGLSRAATWRNEYGSIATPAKEINSEDFG